MRNTKKAARVPEQREMFTKQEMGVNSKAKNQSKRIVTSAISSPDLVKFIYEQGSNEQPASYEVSASLSAFTAGGIQ
jgi:hypothetical protein